MTTPTHPIARFIYAAEFVRLRAEAVKHRERMSWPDTGKPPLIDMLSIHECALEAVQDWQALDTTAKEETP